MDFIHVLTTPSTRRTQPWVGATEHLGNPKIGDFDMALVSEK